DTARTVSALDPSRAVRRRADVALVVAILRPLPDIAHHVVETEPVRGKRADRRCLPGIPLAATGVAVGIVGCNGVAPGIGRLWPGARRILVFSPRGQPIRLAGLLRQPSDVSFGIVPGNVDHRSAATAPAFIGGLVAVAAATGRARIPFVEGHRKPADCKW